MHAEQRQHVRFKAFDGASVLIRSAKKEMRGTLVDISKSGASIEYVPSQESLNACALDIISDTKNFRIVKIPCTTVFEFELYSENFTPLDMRRVGVHFEALTFNQFLDLVYFINECLGYLAPVNTIVSSPSLGRKRAMNESDPAQNGQMQFFADLFTKRRKHLRKPCEIAISYATRAHALEDVIKNISLGGVYIQTRMPLDTGQSLSMKFQLPNSREIIHVNGEIVWVGFEGVGVKFSSTALVDKTHYFDELNTNRDTSSRIDGEIKQMGKIKKKRIRWQPSTSNDVINYRLYWSNHGELNYNSTHTDLGNVTEVILPDDVASFPPESGNIELGVSAINQSGNESDITKFSAYFNFTVPDAPQGLELEDA